MRSNQFVAHVARSIARERGETLEEIDAAAESARTTVERIRARVVTERPRGFPVGAPARGSERGERSRLTAHEKIAAGLQERMI